MSVDNTGNKLSNKIASFENIKSGRQLKQPNYKITGVIDSRNLNQNNSKTFELEA